MAGCLDQPDPGLDFYNQAEAGSTWKIDVQLVASRSQGCPTIPPEIAQVPHANGAELELDFQLNESDVGGDVQTLHSTSATFEQPVNGYALECTLVDAQVQPGTCRWGGAADCNYSFTALPAQ